MKEENKAVKFKYALGIEVEDITCGFKGIITSREQCLNGCLQYTVQPTMKSVTSERKDAWRIDEGQLVRLGLGINDKVETKPARIATGGPSTRVSGNGRVT